MKSYAFPFAFTGAVLIAALLAVTNLITSPGVLWFVCALPLLAGWPAGVYLLKRKRYTAFSLAYSLLIIALLAALNRVVTPGTLWFAYAVPLVLLWPACMLFKGKMLRLPFALLLSVFITVYCVLINFWLTPGRIWAIHPIFAALWWPLSLYFTGKGYYKGFSVAGAMMTILYLIGCNLLTTPYPWALYACFPVLGWPLSMFLGKRFGSFGFSLIGSLIVLAWYGALNIFLEPGSPWIIFIAFPILWWPLLVYFHGKHRPDFYAVVMSLISIAFFAAVNLIHSPGALWAIYPVFAILWWPLTLLFVQKKAWRAYAFAASALTIAFFVAVNLITSPGFLWSLFPSLAMLWWPLAMAFKGKHKPFGFSLAGAALAIGTVAAVNLITSPGFLWSLLAAWGILWWPAAVGFAQKKSPLGLSVTGSLLIIALAASINLITSPGFLWCVFPIFGVLWWPAALLFFNAKKRRLAETKA